MLCLLVMNANFVLWNKMDTKIPKMSPTSSSDPWLKLIQVWNLFREEKLVKLLEKMARIPNDFMQENGDHVNEKDL